MDIRDYDPNGKLERECPTGNPRATFCRLCHRAKFSVADGILACRACDHIPQAPR